MKKFLSGAFMVLALLAVIAIWLGYVFGIPYIAYRIFDNSYSYHLAIWLFILYVWERLRVLTLRAKLKRLTDVADIFENFTKGL